MKMILTLEAPNTTIAEFANTVDPDGMAHNENIGSFFFFKFCRHNSVVCFLKALKLPPTVHII